MKSAKYSEFKIILIYAKCFYTDVTHFVVWLHGLKDGSMKFIGIHLDNKLTWESHFGFVTRKMCSCISPKKSITI